MGKRTKVAEIAFSITGEFLTEHARGLVLCGPTKWRSALSLLVDDIDGMTHEIAFAILRGEKTLAGSSETEQGIHLADSDPNDPDVVSYLNNFRYQWAGLWKYKDRVYRPYAKVTAFDDRDLDFSASKFDPDWNEDRSWDIPFSVLAGRALYYARDSDRDISTISTDGVSYYVKVLDVDTARVLSPFRGAVLWEPVIDYPLWITPFTDANLALNDALSVGHRLEEHECDTVVQARMSNGTQAEFPNVDVTNFRVEPPVDHPRFEECVLDNDRKLTIEERIAIEEQAAAEREAQYQLKLLELRKEIINAVGPDDANWLSLPVRKDDGAPDAEPYCYLRVPRAPFIVWVYNRSMAYVLDPDLVPDWKVISPQGMKMMNDDPVHSDWVIGAGLDPDTFYDHDDYNMASYRARAKILEDTLRFDMEVFAGSGYVSGDIKWLEPGDVLTEKGQIGVILTGSMEYDSALRSAQKLGGTIIMATGGRVCHAAIVARETGLNLIMWDKVRSLRDGQWVSIDLDRRTILVGSI